MVFNWKEDKEDFESSNLESERRALRETYEVFWRDWNETWASIGGFIAWLYSSVDGALVRDDAIKLMKRMKKIRKVLEKVNRQIIDFDNLFVESIVRVEGEYIGHLEGVIDG